MKLIYITSYSFPSKHAEPYYIKSMAEAFTTRLNDNFSLIMNGDIPSDLLCANPVSVNAPKRFRIIFYFFWFLIHIKTNKWNTHEVIFMSNDPYLLSILIFWRKISRFQYKICSDWHQLFGDWRDAFVLKNSDYLFTTTKKLKECIVSNHAIQPEKILVAYGGINPDLFNDSIDIEKSTLRARLALPQHEHLVGYMGAFKSLGLEKGLETMMRSLQYLDKNIQIVLVGGTDAYIAEYKKLAQTVGVEDRCILVRKQTFDTLIQYELAMDILVIPYPDKPHFRNYGFPMKVWEYLATGRPIIYSKLDIIAEVLEGRGTPFIPDDPKDLARVIRTTLENREEIETAALRNRSIVKEYTWNKRAELVLQFISK